MKVSFNGKEIELKKEDVEIFRRLPNNLRSFRILLPEGLRTEYFNYFDKLDDLFRAVSKNDEKKAQNAVDGLKDFDKFLLKEINGKSVYDLIYTLPEKKEELDKLFSSLNSLFGIKPKLEGPAENEIPDGNKNKPEEPEENGILDGNKNNLEGPAENEGGLSAKFNEAIKDWKTIFAGEKDVYSYGDFLKDAYNRGLSSDDDLPFLKSAYSLFARFEQEDQLDYLKFFIRDDKGGKKKGEDIVRFVADFAHANHSNNEEYIRYETEIVKKYNTTFNGIRPEMKVAEYDPEKKEDYYPRRYIPANLLRILRLNLPLNSPNSAVNRVNNMNLTQEFRYEAYVALTGKNDGEIERLKEMFGTSKGLLGGLNTGEYDRVKRALDNYTTARNTLKEKVSKLKGTGNGIDVFRENDFSHGDFMEVSIRRKNLEKALIEYIVKKTKGTGNRIGDVKIEDKKGYGAARLSSAMLLLNILREEKGSSMDISQRRTEYTVSATNFKKLFDEEKANAGGRRKTSERAIERYKQDRRQRQVNENGAVKKKGKGGL